MAFGVRRWVALGSGAVLLAAVITGCAQSAEQGAQPSGHAGGPNFARDDNANFAAAQLGMKLLADLPPLPGYAGLRIVSYGIEVDLVGPPVAAVKTVVARDAQQYQGKPIPVRYRSVRYTEKELDAVKARIEADSAAWAAQGIRLTTWGIDLPSNTVQVGLYHYTTGYRDVLLARYGDRVSVTPYDVRSSGL